MNNKVLPPLPFGMLETKYRDIADGNYQKSFIFVEVAFELETKYRDIADGNLSTRATWIVYLNDCWKPSTAI